MIRATSVASATSHEKWAEPPFSSLQLRHSPTLPWGRLIYVTSTSHTSPGEPPMTRSKMYVIMEKIILVSRWFLNDLEHNDKCHDWSELLCCKTNVRISSEIRIEFYEENTHILIGNPPERNVCGNEMIPMLFKTNEQYKPKRIAGTIIASKLVYGRKICDLTKLTPLATHTLLYSRKWPRSPRKTFNICDLTELLTPLATHTLLYSRKWLRSPRKTFNICDLTELLTPLAIHTFSAHVNDRGPLVKNLKKSTSFFVAVWLCSYLYKPKDFHCNHLHSFIIDK